MPEVDDCTSRNRRGRRVLEVGSFEDNSHLFGQKDGFASYQREPHVVVQHRVHVLDPVGFDAAVEGDELPPA